jgi:cytochrome c556
MSRLPFAGFVENTAGTEKGSPKPNVWTERAKFDQGAKKLQEDMAKLVPAARSLDTLKVAFNDAAKNCKACHDDFRNK